MGVSPLSFTEINAWAGGQQIMLNPFDHQAIADMSRAYCQVACGEGAAPFPLDGGESHKSMEEANIRSWIALSIKASKKQNG